MLDDLLVLELASVLAGPSVGQFFAELGATVLKVENPRTDGDVTRWWRTPGEADARTSDDRSAYFCYCNWGKQSIALDLSTDDGQKLLHRLAGQADIILASFRPGRGDALKADYETLSALNSDLIYGHVTGYGPDRPRAGYDAVVQAESGFMHMNGPAEGPPTKLPVALMDVLAAHQLKEGLLLALLGRERGGGDQYVPVSLFQAAVSSLANQATNWLVDGHSPQRMGSAHPNIAPYGTPYPTADDPPVVLAVGTDDQFASLCEVLHLPDLPSSPNFSTNDQRVEHRAALDRVLSARIGQFEAEPLLKALEERNVPAGAVRDIPAVFEQPAAQHMVLKTGDGPSGLRQVAFTDSTDSGNLSPPPHYAEHTAAVLQEYLEMSTAEVETLTDRQVVAGPKAGGEESLRDTG